MRSGLATLLAGAGLLLGLVGCAAKPDAKLVDTAYCGELGLARQHLIDDQMKDTRKPEEKEKDRNYVLNQLRCGLCTLSDGYVVTSDPAFMKVYETLDKSGINKDKEVASFVLNEQEVKVWKGEPFEQALAMTYIAMHEAARDSWDNARSASIRSLFSLRDFGNDASGKHMTKVELVNRAVEEDQKNNVKPDAEGGGYLDKGYTARETNFALGYLMAGISNQQYFLESGDSARMDEANDYYNKALQYQPELKDLVAQLRTGKYNTLLVVDFGRGPQKIGTGMDQVIADFAPITPSNGARLVVTNGTQQTVVPIACDVNSMATDHMWQSFEDARKAKSYIGTALLASGAGVAAYGASQGNRNAELAGVGMMVVGEYMKAQAHADTRYCEVVPQRIYIAPVMITGNEPITLQVEGAPQSTLHLAGLSAPRGKRTAQLRYVRLITEGSIPPQWATSGQVIYGNEYLPSAGQVKLPYILGGDDVRLPSEEALSSYQAQGFLQGYSPSQLADLYKAEGINPTDEQEGTPGLHVLEGGKSLVSPMPGTLGYARLFGQRHAPYKAISPQVKQLQQEYAGKVASLRGGAVAMAR